MDDLNKITSKYKGKKTFLNKKAFKYQIAINDIDVIKKFGVKSFHTNIVTDYKSNIIFKENVLITSLADGLD